MSTPTPIPAGLMGALAGAQSMQPQTLGNTTGDTGSGFQAALQSAIATLQSAVGMAPDDATAQTLDFVIQRLQGLSSPQFTAALTALRGMR